MDNLKHFALGAVVGLIIAVLFVLILDFGPKVRKPIKSNWPIQIEGTIGEKPFVITVTGYHQKYR